MANYKSKSYGTQKLRDKLREDCIKFIRNHKREWKKEGFVLTDEGLVWIFRKMVQEEGKGWLDVEEFTGYKDGKKRERKACQNSKIERHSYRAEHQ